MTISCAIPWTVVSPGAGNAVRPKAGCLEALTGEADRVAAAACYEASSGGLLLLYRASGSISRFAWRLLSRREIASPFYLPQVTSCRFSKVSTQNQGGDLGDATLYPDRQKGLLGLCAQHRGGGREGAKQCPVRQIETRVLLPLMDRGMRFDMEGRAH